MNEATLATYKAASSAPLIENQYVKDLFSILEDNGRDTSGLAALLSHVSEMESFVKHTEDKITDMKSQLTEMKEAQDYPVKTVLQTAIKTLEYKMTDVKIKLTKIKTSIAGGCKNAIAAFKDKGTSSLDQLASFFRIKDGLNAWKNDIDSMILTDDKAIKKIETFAAQYHLAGRSIKNMARVVIGKQPLDAKTEAGKLAKVLAAPYIIQKNNLTKLKLSINRAITCLEKLETKAASRQEQRLAERDAAKKPSLLVQLHENLALVEQMKRETLMRERARAKGAEL